MAVSFNTLPEILLAGNKIRVEVSTDNYVTQAGSEAELLLEIDGSITDGDDIVIEWTDEDGTDRSVTMQCGPNDDTGNSFRSIFPQEQLTDYVQNAVVAAFRENFHLFENFDIIYTTSNGNPTMQLTARWRDNIGLSVTNNLSNTTETVTAGVNHNVRENFRIVFGVYMEEVHQSGEFKELAILEKQVYDTGSGYAADFLINEILDNDLLLPSLPTFNQSSITTYNSIIKQFYFRAGERYGSPVEYQAYTTPFTSILQVVRGHLDHMDFLEEEFHNQIIDKDRFLTLEPDNKKVTPEQQEYLYWYRDSPNDADAHLKADIAFKDGSQQTYNLADFTAEGQKIYLIPAGFDQLDIGSQNSNKTVKQYTLYVEHDNGTRISEKRTYIVDRTFYPHVRYFLFENNLGCFDTLKATGRQSTTFDVEKDVIQKLREGDHRATEGDYEVSRSAGRNEYEVSIGYKSKEYLNYVRRCLNSNHVYLIAEDNYLRDYERDGVFVPVIVQPDSFELYTDEDGIHALTFTYREAFDI